MSRLNRVSVCLAVAALLAGALPVSAAPSAARGYIVVFEEGTDPAGLTRQLARQHAFTPRYVYTSAVRGFAANLPAAAADALARNPRVAYVEADGPVWLTEGGEQEGATWGLNRIDQEATLGADTSGNYSYDYDGTGVSAYVIDTGIQISHADFGGRAVNGIDAVDGDAVAQDCNGHGTHVAGTIGGATYGVAKDVTLVAVRVLNCSGSGTWSGVIAGVDWVTDDADTDDDGDADKPAVANMSLGGGANTAVDTAVMNSIASGVNYAVAAGNGNAGGRAQDACKYSPARVAPAMTIGATDSTDTKASWSNYGNCVDWFAPGVRITSAWIGVSNTATRTISGTSMATPHTAGAAALYLEANPSALPADVREGLYAAATAGKVKASKTANNHLLCSLSGRAGYCPASD